jgi:hypothetical protein
MATFLGSPLALGCDAGLSYNATTDTLTTGTLAARNVVVTALPTPGSITVTPTLSQLGGITVVAGAALADGDALSVGDGTGIVPIEFDFAPGDGTTGGAVPIIFDGTETATQIRDAVRAILDASGRDWTTSAQGADGIGLVRATPGAAGGAIAEDVTDAGFSVADWTPPTAATTYTYSLQACAAGGACTAAGAASSTAAGVATLSAAQLNRLSWSAVTGAASYKIRRDVGGATQGVIWSGTALTVDDTGLAGDSSAKPTVDGTGRVSGRALAATGLTSGQIAVAGDGGLLGGSTALRLAGTSASNWTFTIADWVGVSRFALSFLHPTANISWYSGSAYDISISRVGVNTVGIGTNPQVATDGTLKGGAFAATGSGGAAATLTQSSEILSLSTAETTTATLTSLLPANAQILFITGRVTTAITTAASYTVAPTGGAAWVLSGTATTSLTGLAAGSTFVLVPPSGATYTTSTANTLTVTTNANPGAGAIRLVPFYVAITPPSS